MTLHRYELLTTKNVATGSEVNTGTENEKFISPKALADSDVGNANKWTALVKDTDFNDQATSTSTITMLTDQTANIKPGMALKYKLSSVEYFGFCSAITSSLLTIGGIALTTGDGDLTELSYCDLPNSTEVLVFTIPGAFADNVTDSLLNDDLLMKFGFFWRKSNAYLVNVACICTDKDSGTVTTEAKINILHIESVLTSNLEINTALIKSIVNINSNAYKFEFNGDPLDVKLSTLATGTAPNNDALNLTVYLTFVTP